jgi:hypothetical protein
MPVVVVRATAAVSNFVITGLRQGWYRIEYSTGSAPVALVEQKTDRGTITTSIPAAGVITIEYNRKL